MIIARVWEKETMPDQWKQVVIHKKGDTLKYENYRDISLLNTAYRNLSYTLYQRLKTRRGYPGGLPDWVYTAKVHNLQYILHQANFGKKLGTRPFTVLAVCGL